MEAFLKVLFILVMVYYGITFFVKYAVPWLLARFVRKQQEKFFGADGQSSSYKSPASKAKTATKSKSNNHQIKDDKSFGEYVDYEEIDE